MQFVQMCLPNKHHACAFTGKTIVLIYFHTYSIASSFQLRQFQLSVLSGKLPPLTAVVLLMIKMCHVGGKISILKHNIKKWFAWHLPYPSSYIVYVILICTCFYQNFCNRIRHDSKYQKPNLFIDLICDLQICKLNAGCKHVFCTRHTPCYEKSLGADIALKEKKINNMKNHECGLIKFYFPNCFKHNKIAAPLRLVLLLPL